ncbi:MAG: filamentous hemagglutinin N-terminal domain-containing protein, partial [Rickettsiales bacterium]|nr:filamentous hemagglutinin N-terminal domain-containing protein [Rickettsiales bacterium]
MISFITTQAIANVTLIRSAYAYNDINPPQNIIDNPVNYIEADNSRGNGDTHLDRTQNGTPVININTPSQGGVSANYYKDFNVNKENLIFNNYQGEVGNSQLGGALYGNPNFNKTGVKEAEIILNEITTNRISSINGYIEVFGKKADLIIANPNGIMVSGGGFINTSRLSLITGKSSPNGTLDQNGNLNPFLLSKDPNATITIVGINIFDKNNNLIAYNLGIDATDVNYIDLMGRIMEINGDIYGSDNTEINIKTGNDKATYYKDKGFQVNSTNTKETEDTKPQFAIDSTAMGGIYAGKINIISTEDGVGVVNRGDLVSSIDNINFDVNGNIILEDTNLQTLNQEAKIKIQNKSDKNNSVIKINNSNIYAGHVNIETDNLINKNNSVIYGIDSINIESTDNVTNTNNSTIFANNDIEIKSSSIFNKNGTITSGENLTIDLSTDFITEGSIGSIYGTTILSAKNITLDNKITKNEDEDVTINLTGHNVILNASGNITNKKNSTLFASGDMTFNILLNENKLETGNLYNYGTIISTDNISINAENSIYNGNKNSTLQATISAGNNLQITTQNRLMNYGFLQAIGVYRDYVDENGNIFNLKDPTSGNLTLITKATKSSDYKLNNLDLLNEGNDKIVVPLPPEVQDKIDNINNIVDLNELDNLLLTTLNTNNEKEYYLVQKRIRLLAIRDVIEEARENYEFDTDSFAIGSPVTIEDFDENGNEITYLKIITDNDIQEQLKKILGNQYSYDDWKINLTNLETKIDEQIQEQLNRLDKYNEEQKINNPDFVDLDLDGFISLNPTGLEIKIDKNQILLTEKESQEQSRLVKIENLYNSLQQSLNSYDAIDWNSLTETQLKQNVYSLYTIINDTNSFNQDDWTIAEFDTSSASLSDYTKYLSRIRTDNTNQTSVEQTGIHNYGRLFSSNNTTLTSNSVLHNNKDSLIYSNNNINFNVSDILFNNAGGTNIKGESSVGYGIQSKGSININGVNGELTRLNKLINYDGKIEADGNVNIKTNETINYGSDNINYFIDPYAATTHYIKDYGMPCYNCGTGVYKELFYNSILRSNQSQIISNNGTLNIDSNDRITNYNSIIYSKDNMYLTSNELFNTIAEFTAKNVKYRVERRKKRRWQRLWRYKYYTEYKPNQYYLVALKSNNAQSRIVSQKSVVISPNNNLKGIVINNGNTHKTTTKEENISKQNIPYATTNRTNDNFLDKAIETNTLNPLDVIELPTNNYGIFRKSQEPNTHFLYETDPLLLVDTSNFLGSQYFLNRIGLDPFFLDQKFLGDVYMEHNIIKTHLEQIGLFQNNKIADEEIDTYINNLFNTLDEEKVEKIGLTIGKELTKEQINNLEEDIVWYVTKTITLPNKDENGNYETVEVLTPQIYLCQESVNNLLQNTQSHSELRAELSKKRATDKAVEESTIAANKAVTAKENALVVQAKTEAQQKIQSAEEQLAIIDSINKMKTENLEEYNETINSIIENEIKETKKSVKTPCSSRSMTCLRTVEKSQEELLAEAEEILKSKIQSQLEENYFNEIKSAKLNDFYNSEQPQKLFQITYNNTYQSSYDNALTQFEQQNSVKKNTDTMIVGNDIFIQGSNNTTISDDTSSSSILSNAGTIWGNRNVVITVDQINNVTNSVNRDGNIAPQATILANNLLYLNTTQYKTADNLTPKEMEELTNKGYTIDNQTNYILDENNQKIPFSTGQINNIGGTIGSLNQDSTTYISTGTLNNITNSQSEDYKIHNYEETRTYIGSTAQITSGGNLMVETIANHSKDDDAITTTAKTTNKEGGSVNLLGSSLSAKGNMILNVEGDLNSLTVQDYNRTYSKVEIDNGWLGSKTTEINETATLNNLSSNITASNNLTINSNNLLSVGTNFSAGNELNMTATGDINLLNATDYDYNYHYYKKEEFDLVGAIVNVATAATVAALTGGAGAAVMAGASSTIGASNMKKGNETITMNYDETTIGTTLTGNNINIKSGNNTTMISTTITTSNDLNIETGNDLLIGTAEEQHNSYENHNSWGGDIGKAALGGAIT